jgi:hypothetical protein
MQKDAIEPDAGFFTGDFSSFPPTLIEHGLEYQPLSRGYDRP